MSCAIAPVPASQPVYLSALAAASLLPVPCSGCSPAPHSPRPTPPTASTASAWEAAQATPIAAARHENSAAGGDRSAVEADAGDSLLALSVALLQRYLLPLDLG